MSPSRSHVPALPGGTVLVPLSTLQQSAMEWMCAGGGSGFGVNVSLSLRFRGALSKPALERALAFVMARHESLRSCVHRADGRLLQYFAGPADSFDLAVVPTADLAEAEAHIAMRLTSRLDLERGGPLYAELLELSEQDHVLVLILVHTATDAYADDLITNEILAAYDCYVRGLEPSLPVAMSFSEYLRDDIEAGSRLTEAQLRYWGEVMRGCIPALPRRTNYAATAARGRIIRLSLTAAATRRLENFASASKVSLMSVLCSVIFLAAWKEYGIEDVCALTTYMGRDSNRLKTLGARTGRDFLIRAAVDDGTSLHELARKVQATLMRASISSRPPFTHARALAQLSEQHVPGGVTATGGSAPARVHLGITDALRIKRTVQGSTPQLSVERVMPGPLLNDYFQFNAAGDSADAAVDPFDSLLNVLLRRDLSPEPGEPITFVGVFIDDALDENVVRKFLRRVCDIAELVGTRS